MKEYLDILRLGVSEGLTSGQRNYLIQKIKKSLSPDDYLFKKEQISLCLFKDEVLGKVEKIINNYKWKKSI